eukprot:NODE_2312_length_581_cov_251.567669_g1830_i0.p1 GENE.NODE_2312_length_581_cov_251.567669_g1830_i0~~NODE_2312_length_581_cov_251.567669_g1830_i0.p1  ORF type:complete len:138 (+),score=45.93 NODE_2312_length_581_cov_251.567669_g1830_i0:63-416(+)
MLRVLLIIAMFIAVCISGEAPSCTDVMQDCVSTKCSEELRKADSIDLVGCKCWKQVAACYFQAGSGCYGEAQKQDCFDFQPSCGINCDMFSTGGSASIYGFTPLLLLASALVSAFGI